MSARFDAPLDLFDGAVGVDADRTTLVVVAMLALDALWWVLLYGGRVPMPGMSWLMEQGIPMAAPGAMELGAFHVGTVEAVLGYAAMWGVMMWAMMLPAMTRFARDYAAAHDGGTAAAVTALAGFLTSYHAVWALSAVVPLSLHALLPGGIYGFTRANAPLVVGAVLVLTGLYQLSGPKRALLDTCCTAVDDHCDGPLDGLRRGVDHGIDCVLICAGLFFLVLPFFGEMNYFWMVALAGVVTMERLPQWGDEVAAATGVLALLVGLAVLLGQPTFPIGFEMAM